MKESDGRWEGTAVNIGLATARWLAVDGQRVRFPADPPHTHPENGKRAGLIQDVR